MPWVRHHLLLGGSLLLVSASCPDSAYVQCCFALRRLVVIQLEGLLQIKPNLTRYSQQSHFTTIPSQRMLLAIFQVIPIVFRLLELALRCFNGCLTINCCVLFSAKSTYVVHNVGTNPAMPQLASRWRLVVFRCCLGAFGSSSIVLVAF